jgi:hypothetical protein
MTPVVWGEPRGELLEYFFGDGRYGGEDLFAIPRTLVGDDWRTRLAAARRLIQRYRSTSTNARTLDGTPVACGFVDGDYELVPDA